VADIIEKTPSPLSKILPVAGMGEGWGGGEKPQLIELLRKYLPLISNSGFKLYALSFELHDMHTAPPLGLHEQKPDNPLE